MNLLIIFVSLAFTSLCQGSQLKPRIIGGTTAPDHAYPYVAALHYGYRWSNDTFENNLSCGGSIIHQYWILTAAHCVDWRPDSNQFVAVVGTNVITYRDPYKYWIDRVIQHKDYSSTSDTNFDIGLAKTVKAIQFSRTVRAIALPKQDPDEMSGIAVVAGFGSLAPVDFGNIDDETVEKLTKSLPPLQHLKFELYSRERCKAVQPSVTEYHICAVNLNSSGLGLCSGDSGSGLVKDNQVIGIASYVHTTGCAKGYPDVYTNVYKFLNWIKVNTDNAV